DKLLEEVQRLIARKEKFLEAKYGDDPFPEHTRLVEEVRARESGRKRPSGSLAELSDLEQAETDHLARAELEKIIWGRTRLGTAAAVKRLGREIDELIRAAEAGESQRYPG
ncbi:MAG: hypothetical protein ACJ741_17065, partial [Pyrinomonadaceae bacterium]